MQLLIYIFMYCIIVHLLHINALEQEHSQEEKINNLKQKNMQFINERNHMTDKNDQKAETSNRKLR